MATAQASEGGKVWPIVAVGSVLVAATTPINVLLLWLCDGLTGGTAGRNLGGGTILLGGVDNVLLFLVLCGLVALACNRAPTAWRRLALVAALLLHLGVWLGGSLILLALVVATDYAQ